MPPQTDNPYAVLPRAKAQKSDAMTGNPYAALPDATGLDVSTGEGQFWMTNEHGGRLPVSYSKVRQASKLGFTMQAEDRVPFLKAAAADKNLARLFPEMQLPEGVKIAGMNTAGQPILAPAGAEPKGSAARRFASSMWDATGGAVKGMYNALAQGPQTPEEAEIRARPFTGAVDLRLERFIGAPLRSEAHQTAEEFKQSDPWSLHPSQEAVWHREKALGHGLATVVPLVGPAAAQTGEKIGTQFGSGDIAGGLGTVAGNVAMEEAPRLGAKALRSKFITSYLPEKAINRIIRPMGKDVEFGKSPAKAILEEGIIGNSLESIGNKVAAKMNEVGKKIDKVVADPKYANVPVDLTKALQPIDDAMRDALKAGDRRLFRRLAEVRDELGHEWQPTMGTPGQGPYGIKPGMRTAAARNMTMSPPDALTFKRMVGNRIRWSQDALDEPVNGALGEVYSEVKNGLNAAVPELKDLNKSYANLESAKSAIARRLPVENRQSFFKLFDVVLGATALGVPHTWPLLAGKKIAEMPIVKTTVAQGAYRLPRVVPHLPLAVTAPAAVASQLKGSRSLGAAMKLPINKGKSEAEVEQHLRSLGYNVTRP